ncbi:MAG: beta-galactosidase small subunit [Treponema sp.]|nr:beta-galactosidase small subunit [Treponema sp.]
MLCGKISGKGRRKLQLEFSGTDPVTEKNHNISFNASHYTQEELWTKKHDFELEKLAKSKI